MGKTLPDPDWNYSEDHSEQELLNELHDWDVDRLLIDNALTWGTLRDLYNRVMQEALDA